MDHIGIDLHKRESQICILAEGGELIERRIRTDLRRFAEVLGERAPARILLEASTESEPDNSTDALNISRPLQIVKKSRPVPFFPGHSHLVNLERQVVRFR